MMEMKREVKKESANDERPFWGFVLKARDFVDEDMEDRLDKYVRKEKKRIVKKRRKRKWIWTTKGKDGWKISNTGYSLVN